MGADTPSGVDRTVTACSQVRQGDGNRTHACKSNAVHSHFPLPSPILRGPSARWEYLRCRSTEGPHQRTPEMARSGRPIHCLSLLCFVASWTLPTSRCCLSAFSLLCDSPCCWLCLFCWSVLPLCPPTVFPLRFLLSWAALFSFLSGGACTNWAPAWAPAFCPV